MTSSEEQAHICRLSEDPHMPGLDCLSDVQILPIFFAMDPETLLNFGRANRRLHRLVSDMQVWRHLLKGVENFNDRVLKELAEFGKIEDSLEMMLAEVVKEAASRFKISLAVDQLGKNYYDCGKKGLPVFHEKNFSKVAVSIRGFGAPVTFEMGGESHLKELESVSQKVGAKFTIKEVHAFPVSIPTVVWETLNQLNLFLVEFLVQKQQRLRGEGLYKLELSEVYLHKLDSVALNLLKASEEWKIGTLFCIAGFANPLQALIWEKCAQKQFSELSAEMWGELARGAATGQIDTIKVRVHKEDKRAQEKDVKAVWEITKKIQVEANLAGTAGTVIEIVGGQGEPKITWEEAFAVLHTHNIC